jgi:predicted ATPase
MAIIEGIKIKNFRAHKEITLGKLWTQWNTKPLTPLTVVIGKNGVGKSTLFDAFGFLSDCLKKGVEEACDSNGRGGFKRIRSQGVKGAIEFEIYYRQDLNSRPITYELAIDLDKHNRPFIKRERLRQRRKGQRTGWPFSFLLLDKGSGWVWSGDEAGIDENEIGVDGIEESPTVQKIELSDSRMSGISTLGTLKLHPRISAFRNFIENWYLSYFSPDSARSLPLAGPQKHLNIHGDNLGNVVQFMEREHKDRFKVILKKIAKKIPGINDIETEETNDGRLLLKFNDKGFSDPFYSQQMSDGTLKLFAYLLMLNDPSPPPFICIEEPENGLYHKLLESLADEFRIHATGKRGGSQVFITTHQPYLVDALKPDEVWVLTKGKDGFTRINRASNNELISNMVDEGLPLGGLWYSDYLDEG